jgi:peptidoglycan LD-endopeptidase CwlK
MKFGKASMEKMGMLSYDLQWVLRETLALEIIDFTVKCTYRGKEEQDAYYNADPPKSKVRWPDSKHNTNPSKAVDAVPYVNGKASWNKLHCCVLAGVILAVAKKLGVRIRWGGNWDMDGEPITDQDFQDLVHFEEV